MKYYYSTYIVSNYYRNINSDDPELYMHEDNVLIGLLQDDLFVGSLNRFDIISMQTVVRKTMTWINENWTVVEDKASDTDCCTDDSSLMLDSDNPF